MAYADALRTTAIALVVMCHVYYFTHSPTGRTPLMIYYLGNWGLSCFFVLSGMLIGRPYVKSLVGDEPLPRTDVFYRRRFYRVYPLYLAVVVLSVLLSALSTHRSPAAIDIILHAFILQTLNVKTAVSLNGPMWTMGVDVAFYLLLPPVAHALASIVRCRSKRFVMRTLLSLAVLGVAAGVMYRFAMFTTYPDTITNFAAETVFVRNVFGFTPSFCFGFMLALANLQNIQTGKTPALMIVLIGVMIGGVEIVPTFGVVGIAVRFLPHQIAFDSHLRTVGADTLRDPLLACSSAMIFFGCTQIASKRISVIADSSLIVRASMIAYAIYLIHYPIIQLVERYVIHGRIGSSAFLELGLLAAVLTLPVAYALHVSVERPFLRLRDRARPSITSLT